MMCDVPSMAVFIIIIIIIIIIGLTRLCYRHYHLWLNSSLAVTGEGLFVNG
jgi:hypothetical protein